MTPRSPRTTAAAQAARTHEQAGVRTLLLLLLVFVLGLGGGALFYSRSLSRGTATPADAPPLSEATKVVLRSLKAPVEVRFYALLDPASASNSLPAFAGRVDQLLSAYERAAGGKLTVSRQTSPSDAAAKAAVLDGLQVFNLDQGEACFLGVAVAQNGQQASLPQLAVEWESALESDLTRAIVRVISAQPVAAVSAEAAQIETAAIVAVSNSIPDPAALPVEEGTRRLREAALKEFQLAVKEMEVQIKAAQQLLEQAMQGGTEAEQQAARQHLKQVQAEQTRKLQEVAAQAQAQIGVWDRLKGAAAPPATGAVPKTTAPPKP